MNALTEQPTLRVLLYEGTGAQPLEPDDRLAALTTLLEGGYAVTRTGSGRVTPHGRGSLLVMGRFTEGRPPVDQIEQNQLKLDFLDSTNLTAADLLSRAESARAEADAAVPGEWKPWFPVIDYDRCTNCMQCLSFCLFNVYGVDDENRIQAQNHDNCKTNCPACSRVCPEAAIMFPKYKAGPINGDKVTAEDLGGEKMKVDISALLGGDVYAALRSRSVQAKERFSKERDEKQALNERQKCLTKLAQSADIPQEVLLSLPSPEEIARKAEEAKARAEAALARQQSSRNA